MINTFSNRGLWFGGVALLLAILVIGWSAGSLFMVAVSAFTLGIIAGLAAAFQVVDRMITTEEEARQARL